MRFLVYCVLAMMILAACSSNQTSNPDHKSIYNNVDKIPADVENKSNKTVNPTSGKLSDEQVKLYIAVMIKMEQIRYTRDFADIKKSGKKSVKSIEDEAVSDFDVEPRTYRWVKNTIRRTLSLMGSKNTKLNIIKDTNSNSVLMHNIAMLKKHMEGLSFAENYKLPSRPRVTQSGDKASPAFDKQVSNLKTSIA